MEGIENFFSNIVPLKSLSAFLNIVTEHFEKTAPLAHRLVEENEEMISEQLLYEFESLGFILDDHNGEVYNVKATRMEDPLFHLLRLKPPCEDEQREAQFEIISKIHFSADILYDDLETAAYDSEDKVLIPLNTIEETLKEYEIIQAKLTITFMEEQPHDMDIIDLKIQIPQDVFISLEKGDGWTY